MSLSLSDSIHLLGNLLGEVLAAQESPALLAVEERIRARSPRRAARATRRRPLVSRAMSKPCPRPRPRAVASAFTLHFDLVSLAEEVHRIRELRRRTGSRRRRRSASPSGSRGRAPPGGVSE